jgi:hypothetical protein
MLNSLRLPRWVFLWLLISTFVVIWDALFVILRPASFSDGTLGFLWSFAYDIYLKVDLAYADADNLHIAAVAWMSLFEACLVAVCLIADRRGRGHLAHLLALVVTSLTGAKTMLFFLFEAVAGWPSIGHNDLLPLLAFWVIPNGLWIIMPFAVALHTGRRLLHHASIPVSTDH